MGGRARPNAHDLVAEVIRRTNATDSSQIIRLHDPPEPRELLQLAAARILKQTVAIVPAKCGTVEEWLQRYAPTRQT